MESKLSPDIQKKIPPVPIKTYQWEDLKRDREAGGYPWTHVFKSPLEGEITAEDIIRETTPRRSMSRDVSKSRTHSPVDRDVQKILNLDSSPGSSRKHGEGGEDEGVHVPNFSKEISLDFDEEVKISDMVLLKQAESPVRDYLPTPVAKSKSVSPKSILKRSLPEPQYIGATETREKTKCCHPLVNKIKHLADKTMHKLDRNENEKSPVSKRKKNEEIQEIRNLKNSPGAIRRQKFSAIKLGDSDEMSKTMNIETPPLKNKKEHIYEDIEEVSDAQTSTQSTLKIKNEMKCKGHDNTAENKSIASQDPSLVVDDTISLNPNEHIMEKLHNTNDISNRATMLDEEIDYEEANVEEIFQNQKDDMRYKNDSPNITITEIIDDDNGVEHSTTIPIEQSPSPSPCNIERKKTNLESVDRNWSQPNSKLRRWTSEGGTPLEKPVRPTREGSVQLYTPEVRCACQFFQCDSLLPERTNPVGTRPTSRASNIISILSDHEYEIIEKQPPNIIYTAPSVEENPAMLKTDDEISSTASLERKYLEHNSDEDEQNGEKENTGIDKNEELISAETLQKGIDERFFVNTPSTSSRTECEVSTSQVDSSALENLPLKRSSRSKNGESSDSKIQQRIKEGTGKLKLQAGKLKTKLHNLKNKQFTLPERTKVNLPERSKFKVERPERPKFTLPDKRKFSLPEKPKLKSINFTGKLSMGDRKKFSFPERPKFSVPDFSKFKMPDRPKLNFTSITRKKEVNVESNKSESTSDLQNVTTVEFVAKTYPRLFGRKKKSLVQKTSSSPTLNREETPPPTFTFTRVRDKKRDEITSVPNSSEEPREYGIVDSVTNNSNKLDIRDQFSTTYDFDKLDPDFSEDEVEPNQEEPELSSPKQEYTHINEINNDEFFVRPRGISRENIQVREYLSDEIRQAFNISNNVLADMDNVVTLNHENIYADNQDEDPDLVIDSGEGYSIEDVNERDDGYYTFPPVRPSRAKRKKKETESIKFIDDSINTSMQFSEVDLGLSEDPLDEEQFNTNISCNDVNVPKSARDVKHSIDLNSIHEYANDDVIEYPDNVQIEYQTLPMPPKRKKKQYNNNTVKCSSLNDFKSLTHTDTWQASQEPLEDIVVYRTEHEYIVPAAEAALVKQSPLAPRRTRSRSSRTTSFCDDDRTSHGAESLILDTQIPPTNDEEIDVECEIRQESPGYATVDKGQYLPSKTPRRSKSKTPPGIKRKSNSSERKYYTVAGSEASVPNRPPRSKSSTSLITLNSYAKNSVNSEGRQYVEIGEARLEPVHKILQSGEIINRMKDRPLPPPPRPPRGPRRKKILEELQQLKHKSDTCTEFSSECTNEQSGSQEVIEIEVSTQTDPLPDDIDFELGMDENFDISMSSSLRDIIDEESILGKRNSTEPHPISRTTSRSDKSLKLSDPRIAHIERSSPTVILVEKRVSSPTRINERDEILTEASLTVQHINVDEAQIPDVPPLPKASKLTPNNSTKPVITQDNQRDIERSTYIDKDAHVDNLITQRLQVKDLDVGRLNVSELQAKKIFVSDIEGMTLNVNELDSKSGHISVNGIEFSQTVIDEIVKKFAEISTNAIPVVLHTTDGNETAPPQSREEETQTDSLQAEIKTTVNNEAENYLVSHTHNLPRQENIEESAPPQRPPPPDLTPLLYSYLQDIAIPTTSLQVRSHRDRHFSEGRHSTPPPPRRLKKKPTTLHSDSSTDNEKPRPSPRRIAPIKTHEPSITGAGALFLRACQTSISRTFWNIFNSFRSYINGAEDKRDVQMAMVIFLVLIAGLIMFGLSDSRTIHHHHWEFFNPPNGKP